MKYLENQKGEILDDYMVFRFLASEYESSLIFSDDKSENCVITTEIFFPSVVTSMFIHERGLEESKKAQEMVRSMKIHNIKKL